MSSLLPYNSTKFERDVEQAIAYDLAVEVLHGFKFKTAYGAADSDSIIGSRLSLAWEYSLAQVNIDDFAERVLKGLEFHRLRGTPVSLRNALSWYGFDNIIIEEEIPGEHFAEFQIGINEIPNGFVPDPVINVAAFAAPLRSRLSRMYNKLYDERRFVFDDSLLDEGLLSDDSGTRLTEDGPKLSFGRTNTRSIEMPTPVVSAAASRDHFVMAKNIDTWRLDFATFDDLPSDAINRKAAIERERTVFNATPLGEIPANLFEPQNFSKASIVLSEDAKFDDVNATFSGGYDEVDEEPFILSFTPLSSGKRTVRRIFIDEYFLREKGFHAVNDFEPEVLSGVRERERSVVLECDFNVTSGIDRNHFAAVEYKGADTWREHRHFSVPWNQISEYTPILDIETE
jgi:P2-related tail formation protein